MSVFRSSRTLVAMSLTVGLWRSLVALVVETFIILVRTTGLGWRRSLVILLGRIAVAVLVVRFLIWLLIVLLILRVIVIFILCILLVVIATLPSIGIMVSIRGLLSIPTIASAFRINMSTSYVCWLSGVSIDCRCWSLSRLLWLPLRGVIWLP